MITLIELAVKHFQAISITARVFGLVLFLLIALSAFTAVIDAIFEIVAHIAQIYTSSDSITRLIIWIVAALFLRKLVPCFSRLLERWF